MVEEKKVVDNATETAVGDTFQTEEGKEAVNKIIDYKTYDKVMGSLKRTNDKNEALSNQNSELIQKLSTFEKNVKDQEEKKLTEKGEFQKLNELKQLKIDELKVQLEAEAEEKKQANGALEDTWKLQSFYDKLPGKLKNRKHLKHVDLDQIIFNHETGECDPQSVDIVVNGFMEEFPETVDTSHFGKLPGDAARGGKVNTKFSDLPLSEMRNNMKSSVQAARKKLGV